MRYCINITSGPLTGTLEDDNLRGEGRWERMMARGLLATGEPVGTPLPKWAGDSPNWIGHIENLSDCAYITIYGGLETLPRTARVYMLQFFSAPNEPIIEEFRKIIAFAGRHNVWLMHSYLSDGCFDNLPDDLRDRAAWWPLPVADPVDGDATEKTVLFNPSRYSLGITGEMVDFVRRALERDPRLTFEMVSGTYLSESAEAIWAHPVFAAAFDHLRHRVVVHPPLCGPEVQRIYARTRLVVCPSGYGGPPVESARYGIPVIALERDCSFYTARYTPGFPELPRLNVDGTLAEILDRLLYDTPYARRVGDACRRYVAEHFSYAAFARVLRRILSE